MLALFGSVNEAFSGEEHQSFHWDGGRCAALLVHGFPGTPAEMRPVAQALHDLGWTVRGVLLPGFGSDIQNIHNRTHDDWLGSVGAELFELRRQYDKVILVGYSMGGAICITLATQQPVDGLVLFSPFVEVDHMLWKALPAIRLFLPKIKIFKLFKPDFNDPQTRDGILKFMPKADLDDPEVRQGILDFELPISMFNEIRAIGYKSTQVTDLLTMPVQVFQGLDDELVIPDRTRNLIQSIPQVFDYSEVSAPHEIINSDLPAWSIIVEQLTRYANYIVDKGA